ncbi:MAG TPA: ribonuclease P protein component [Burkholderiaceae bacterium]|nr:ribonuclease P protein component [Burkholderiaceae bacterium]
MPKPLEPLLHASDFERVLKTPTRARSEHFALHQVFARPLHAQWPSRPPASPIRVIAALHPELSTDAAPQTNVPVDDFRHVLPERGTCWLGMVVPKRHARRSVTRSLIKRQVRVALARRLAELPSGMWVVRLRSPFDRQQFRSAAGLALKQAVRHELDEMLDRTCRPSSPRQCVGTERPVAS